MEGLRVLSIRALGCQALLLQEELTPLNTQVDVRVLDQSGLCFQTLAHYRQGPRQAISAPNPTTCLWLEPPACLSSSMSRTGSPVPRGWEQSHPGSPGSGAMLGSSTGASS